MIFVGRLHFRAHKCMSLPSVSAVSNYTSLILELRSVGNKESGVGLFSTGTILLQILKENDTDSMMISRVVT